MRITVISGMGLVLAGAVVPAGAQAFWDGSNKKQQAQVEAPQAEQPAPQFIGDYFVLPFEQLKGYAYTEPHPDQIARRAQPDQIPAAVKSLNTTKVALEGFMVPTAVDNQQRVEEFVLFPDQQSCCFGVPPTMNGWVYVFAKEEKPDYLPDVPLRVFGTLEVGEEIEENTVISLYRMQADKIEVLEGSGRAFFR
jgi:hypothetical protein